MYKWKVAKFRCFFSLSNKRLLHLKKGSVDDHSDMNTAKNDTDAIFFWSSKCLHERKNTSCTRPQHYNACTLTAPVRPCRIPFRQLKLSSTREKSRTFLGAHRINNKLKASSLDFKRGFNFSSSGCPSERQ